MASAYPTRPRSLFRLHCQPVPRPESFANCCSTGAATLNIQSNVIWRGCVHQLMSSSCSLCCWASNPHRGQSRSSFVTHISPQILNISNKPCVFAQLDCQSPKLMVSFSGALKYPHTDEPIGCLRARKCWQGFVVTKSRSYQ